MSDKATQCEAILDLLRKRGDRGITPLEALDIVHSYRLGARIFDLRKQGHDIRTYTVPTREGARHARYVLVPPKPPVDAGEQVDMGLAS